MNWLDHGRTLREQGVEETEMLLLRRKFFYSDQNVDSRDPVQLNLLYVQVGKSLAVLCCYDSFAVVLHVAWASGFQPFKKNVFWFCFLPGQGRHSEWIPSSLL